MRKVVIFIISLFISFIAIGQTKPKVWTKSTKGRTTEKSCDLVYFGDGVKDFDNDVVTFIETETKYQRFYKAGKDSKGNGIWIDYTTKKVIKREQLDGVMYFVVSEKKIYSYTIKNEI